MGSRRPIVSAHDFGVLSGIPMMAAVSWTTAERTWNTVARNASHYAGAILSRSPEKIAQRVREIAGKHDLPLTPSEIAQQLVTFEIETAMQIIRGHAPKRWVPDISIEGEANLETELSEEGVLWE